MMMIIITRYPASEDRLIVRPLLSRVCALRLQPAEPQPYTAPSRHGATDPRAGLARGGAPVRHPRERRVPRSVPIAAAQEARCHARRTAATAPSFHRTAHSEAQRPAHAGEPPPFPSPLRTSACVSATTGDHLTPPLC